MRHRICDYDPLNGLYGVIRGSRNHNKLRQASAHFASRLSKERKFNWRTGLKTLKWICSGCIEDLCLAIDSSKNTSFMLSHKRSPDHPRGLRIISGKPKWLRKMPGEWKAPKVILLRQKTRWKIHGLKVDLTSLVVLFSKISRSWKSPNQVQVRSKYFYQKFTKFE